MNKFNEISININKALITAIRIEIEDGVPVFYVTTSLITDKGLKISEVQLSSLNWYPNDKKLDFIPTNVHSAALEIFKAFTPVVNDKINGMFKELEAPKEEEKSEFDEIFTS